MIKTETKTPHVILKKIIKKHKIVVIISTILLLINIALWLWYRQIRVDSTQRNRDIQYIGQLLEKYHDRYGIYPCPLQTIECRWDEELQKVNNGSPIPKDPNTHKKYFYLTDGGNSLVGAVKDYEALLCVKSRILWVVYKTTFKMMDTNCTGIEELSLRDLTEPTPKANHEYLNWPSAELWLHSWF